jgi:hypothetical protein
MTPAFTAIPPTGSTCTTPMVSVVASGTVVAPNVWLGEVDDGVHRQMVARVQRDAEVAGVVLLAPLDRAVVGQAYEAGARLDAGDELRAVLERLEAVTVTAPSFRM